MVDDKQEFQDQALREDDYVDPGSASGLASTEPPYLELLEGHMIRLVDLLPGRSDDPLELRLSIHDLEKGPKYEAISYVWGDVKDQTKILCNGKEFDITKNLAAAFRRVRYEDRVRRVWADAMCINQGSVPERNHHVAFMNLVYQFAEKVLVYIGNDSKGEAADVGALIDEHVSRASAYVSIRVMPLLLATDPLLDDPRWRSLATLMKSKWFSRVWVMQEVGVAKDPRVLYGKTEFGYRHFMQLSRWIVRCAPQLEPRMGISLLTIHTDWEDWTDGWRATQDYEYSLIDFLSHAKGLQCSVPHDHIYAFIGHPLARNDDGSGPIIIPKYEQSITEIYHEFTALLLPRFGLKVLSAVEHDKDTIVEEVPSWAVRWDMDVIQNSMGYYSGFYYRASGNEESTYPLLPEGDRLSVEGAFIDTVHSVCHFSPTDTDWEVIDAATALTPESKLSIVLQQIWSLFANNDTPCSYAPDKRLDAFSLTLCAGLMNYERASESLDQHRANFAAFWKLFQQTRPEAHTSIEFYATEAEGDADAFYYDLSLSCKGRSFFITTQGYFGLGPLILRPDDICYIFRGARVPFAVRNVEDYGSARLLGEAYIHGLMTGELLLLKGESPWSDVVIR